MYIITLFSYYRISLQLILIFRVVVNQILLHIIFILQVGLYFIVLLIIIVAVFYNSYCIDLYLFCLYTALFSRAEVEISSE